MPRDRDPLGTSARGSSRPTNQGARIPRMPGPIVVAGPRADARSQGGWMRFDGFHLRWYDSPYPSTQRVGYVTRAQSGVTIPIKKLGIVQGAVQRSFADSKYENIGPIPEGMYDILVNDAGPARLLPDLLEALDQEGNVTGRYRWMIGIRGMQRIQDDLEYFVDLPETEENEACFQVGAWGRYRARILPRHGTRTFGRGGFYLHSSRKIQGTHGCIETLGDEEIFKRLMRVRERRRVRKIRLLVAGVSPDLFDVEVQGLREMTWSAGDF